MTDDLDIARTLISHGIPVFVAQPATMANGEWDIHWAGTPGADTGFHPAGKVLDLTCTSSTTIGPAMP